MNAHAADDVRVLVVGNPANTNAYITRSHAPDIPAERFTAMMRLDHNRAISQLATRAAAPVAAIRRVTVWGNHSTTQYPDLSHAQIDGVPVAELVPKSWIKEEFIPTVAGRGAAVIETRGASSAASAANAAIEHLRDWIAGTADGDWTSAAVVADGSYGVPEGVMAGLPVVSRAGTFEIVQGLTIDDFSRQRIDRSITELVEERDAVTSLGLVAARRRTGPGTRLAAIPMTSRMKSLANETAAAGRPAAASSQR